MTGPDDREPAGPEPDQPVEDEDQPLSLVDDALAEAFASGLRVTRPDDGPWRGLVCPACGESFDTPAEPAWPRRVARRIRRFIERHRRHLGEE